MRSLAIRGSIWTMVGFGGGQILRLAGNIVLTRLLFPQAFGLMALVATFMQGLAMFSDIGIGPSIIQNPRGDDDKFLNTAWTIQIIRGLGLLICACIIAGPVAWFYDEPMLLQLIPAVGFTAFISGFFSTRLISCNRHLALGRLTIVDLTGNILALGATIALAYQFRSVWALVISGLFGAIIRLALSHTALPGIRNRLSWDADCRRELFRFGRWIFLSTVLTFFALQADRLVFGKMIPLAMLGIYSIAVTLTAVPTSAITRISSTVVFPAYTRRDLASIFHRMRLPLLVLGGCAVAGMIAAGPLMIRLLYDPRYHAAGAIVQILAIGVWFQVLESTNGSALLAIGKANWVAAGNAAKIAGMLALIPIGFHYYNFNGALAALVASDALKYAVSAIGVRRQGLKCWAHDATFTALIAATTLIAIFPSHHWPTKNLFAIAIVSVILAMAWAPMAFWSLRRREVIA